MYSTSRCNSPYAHHTYLLQLYNTWRNCVLCTRKTGKSDKKLHQNNAKADFAGHSKLQMTCEQLCQRSISPPQNTTESASLLITEQQWPTFLWLLRQTFYISNNSSMNVYMPSKMTSKILYHKASNTKPLLKQSDLLLKAINSCLKSTLHLHF